jgi:hypothetical protein
MSKRQTPADVIVNFFTTASYVEAQLLHGIVRGIMKRRLHAEDPAPNVLIRRRKAKVNAKPASATGTVAVSPLVGEVHA